jgi:hypothetical protein
MNTKTSPKSRLSSTLLSNYMLTISLLKNIATKFTNPETFEKDFETQLVSMKNFIKTLATSQQRPVAVSVTDFDHEPETK